MSGLGIWISLGLGVAAWVVIVLAYRKATTLLASVPTNPGRDGEDGTLYASHERYVRQLEEAVTALADRVMKLERSARGVETAEASSLRWRSVVRDRDEIDEDSYGGPPETEWRSEEGEEEDWTRQALFEEEKRREQSILT